MLTLTQSSLIETISSGVGCTVSSLCALHGLSKSAVSRNLRAMVALGYLSSKRVTGVTVYSVAG